MGGHKGIRCAVTMLDESVLTFNLALRAMGEELRQEVVKSMQMFETDYFGLEFTHKEGFQAWLDLEKPISKQCPLNKNTYEFQFQVKFYTPDPTLLEDEFTRYQFALQVRQDLATGRLQCNFNTTAMLVAYIAQAELGDIESVEGYRDGAPSSENTGYLHGTQYVPNQGEELNVKIVEYHINLKGVSPADADLTLLDTARKTDFYGIVLYPAKDHEGAHLSLAVIESGILVFQNSQRINTFSWAKIRKLSFKRLRFLIKLAPSEEHDYRKNMVAFHMASRNSSKHFWKVCVEHHSFFRATRAPATMPRPRRRRVSLSRGSSFRYTGRTQKQLLDHVKENFVRPTPFERTLSSRASSRRQLGASASTTLNSRHRDMGASMEAGSSLSSGSHMIASTSGLSPTHTGGATSDHSTTGEMSSFHPGTNDAPMQRSLPSVPSPNSERGGSPVFVLGTPRSSAASPMFATGVVHPASPVHRLMHSPPTCTLQANCENEASRRPPYSVQNANDNDQKPNGEVYNGFSQHHGGSEAKDGGSQFMDIPLLSPRSSQSSTALPSNSLLSKSPDVRSPTSTSYQSFQLTSDGRKGIDPNEAVFGSPRLLDISKQNSSMISADFGTAVISGDTLSESSCSSDTSSSSNRESRALPPTAEDLQPPSYEFVSTHKDSTTGSNSPIYLQTSDSEDAYTQNRSGPTSPASRNIANELAAVSNAPVSPDEEEDLSEHLKHLANVIGSWSASGTRPLPSPPSNNNKSLSTAPVRANIPDHSASQRRRHFFHSSQSPPLGASAVNARVRGSSASSVNHNEDEVLAEFEKASRRGTLESTRSADEQMADMIEVGEIAARVMESDPFDLPHIARDPSVLITEARQAVRRELHSRAASTSSTQAAYVAEESDMVLSLTSMSPTFGNSPLMSPIDPGFKLTADIARELESLDAFVLSQSEAELSAQEEDPCEGRRRGAADPCEGRRRGAAEETNYDSDESPPALPPRSSRISTSSIHSVCSKPSVKEDLHLPALPPKTYHSRQACSPRSDDAPCLPPKRQSSVAACAMIQVSELQPVDYLSAHESIDQQFYEPQFNRSLIKSTDVDADLDGTKNNAHNSQTEPVSSSSIQVVKKPAFPIFTGDKSGSHNGNIIRRQRSTSLGVSVSGQRGEDECGVKGEKVITDERARERETYSTSSSGSSSAPSSTEGVHEFIDDSSSNVETIDSEVVRGDQPNLDSSQGFSMTVMSSSSVMYSNPMATQDDTIGLVLDHISSLKTGPLSAELICSSENLREPGVNGTEVTAQSPIVFGALGVDTSPEYTSGGTPQGVSNAQPQPTSLLLSPSVPIVLDVGDVGDDDDVFLGLQSPRQLLLQQQQQQPALLSPAKPMTVNGTSPNLSPNLSDVSGSIGGLSSWEEGKRKGPVIVVVESSSTSSESDSSSGSTSSEEPLPGNGMQPDELSDSFFSNPYAGI